MKKITFLFLGLLATFSVSYGQIASSTFSQSNGTYSPLIGGTNVATYAGASTGAERMDDAVYNLPAATIPFMFNYNGVGYDGLNVNSNGYITFGTTSPGAATYTPISSATAYDGAISAFGRDLEGGYVFAADRTTGSFDLLNASNIGPAQVGDFIDGTGILAGTTISAISGSTITISAAATTTGTAGPCRIGNPLWSNIKYGVVGVSPNRVFVVQYSNFKRFGTTLTTVQHMNLNFQIRLHETSNNIEIVYGNSSPGLTTFTTVNQVGLRGANNTFATNVNNRANTKGTNDDWLNSVQGTLNNSGLLYNNVTPANLISNGLTYTWVQPALPAVVPSCAANPVSTPNATCGNFASTISWDATATATGYNLTVGTTSGGTDVVNNVNIGNVITYNLPVQTAGTTYFWKVVPFNNVGPAVGCTENSYTTFATACYCASVPSSNDNSGVTNVTLNTTDFPTADVTYVDNTATPVTFAQGLLANTQISFATGFTYKADIWIDFNNDFDFDDTGELVQTGILSTNTNPTVLDASFTMPANAPLGQHRMRIGTADDVQTPPNPCYSGSWGVTLDFTVNIIIAPTDLPDDANLQFPDNATIVQCGNVTVYGQVFEAGLTDVAPNIVGQAPGINAWVGISPIGSNTNPNTWTTWIPATWNSGSIGNKDEYQASIGSTVAPGTYYYATRFQLNGGAYVYGGTNNGFWDGTTRVSGVLTVNPATLPDYVNLQSPASATITQGGSVSVSGEIYEFGVTDITAGQAPCILAWVGISPVGSNTNPNTWTTWIPATFFAETGNGNNNNDQYKATIGATLAPGTYYYATRFQLSGGAFVYGGINATNDGSFWDGTTFNSGVLTVNAAPAPANDECAGAITLTPGGVFADNDIDSSNIGATLSADTPIPTCGATNFATVGKDVWYNVEVPASGTLTIETGTNAAAQGLDTVFSVYSGSCGSIVQVGCDDDGATETAFGFSKLVLTGQISGATLLIRLFGWNGAQGSYSISAYDASLGNSSFDNASFSYYPNPVKNNLNLSYSQEISTVEVFNLLGQKVSSNTINANAAQVDMSNLSKGAYMVRVSSNNQVKTIKVIKE